MLEIFEKVKIIFPFLFYNSFIYQENNKLWFHLFDVCIMCPKIEDIIRKRKIRIFSSKRLGKLPTVLQCRKWDRVGSSPGCLSPKPTLGPHSALPFLSLLAPISCLPLVYSSFCPHSWRNPKVKHCFRHSENKERERVVVCVPPQPCSVWSCPGGGCRQELGDVLCIIVYNGKTTSYPSIGEWINNMWLLHNINLCSHCNKPSSCLENNVNWYVLNEPTWWF